jgi:uncharacterized membrane protein YfcA
MEWWAWYLAVGAFVGFFAGLLGVGGGLVTVPALAMIFGAQRFPADHVLHLALGTSMAAILFTSISSLREHHRHGAVMWPVVRDITPGILIGTALGTVLARQVSTRALAIFFAAFVLFVAAQMMFNLKPKPSRQLPGKLAVSGVGAGIGAISSLAAIGGGALTVPFLTWCNVKVHNAIGTSAAIGFPIALGGAVGYIVNGLSVAALPQWSLGFVYLPALAWLVASSMLTAPLGARTAHRLPVPTLKRVFAGVLVLLSAKMLWGLF